ncbi:MAG: uroporphyrinogen-III C-methyltransferase [Clostridiales bacterium]
MSKGFVALVGAGPGELGLLTLRGMEFLKKAEVVVYDRLVSEEILRISSESALKIDVGKKSSYHLVGQEKINEILLKEALRGKRVVRLKGGDPFLFGRGAEELELLVQNNIPFEVVPGITSAISVPSYAGIPVTHRDFCSSVHIITGHKKANEPLNIDFESLVKIGGTLVFLMGVSSLKQITDGLIDAGMDKKMTTAIVENGTRGNQRKIVTTIESLFEETVKKDIKSPAVVIVGEVCALSEKYDWHAKKILSGEKIIVTRPKSSGGTLSSYLKELGADVYDSPCVEIHEILKNEILEKAIENIKGYEWLAFTSRNGVKVFFNYLKNNKKDFRILKDIKIAAIGKPTADSLNEYGIFADFIPEIYDGKHLGEGLCELVNKQGKILLLRALKGSKEIINIFEKAGKKFNDIAIYETSYINMNKDKIEQLINEKNDIYVTFTSVSTVEGFVKSMGKIDFTKIIGICIGNQTAEAARKYAIKYYISDEATIESIIKKFLEVKND